jgi:L,D-peptidoglycan transpeptidase YkuD (ErfK/YbiS/YcfS/YnhG family)
VRRLIVAVLAAMLATVLAPTSPASAATVRLGGVSVFLHPGTSQVVTVDHTRGWHARVELWQRAGSGWQRLATYRDGRTGYGGLVAGARRRQGTGTTPLGTYRLTDTFGTHARASTWRLPHRQIRPGDYWVADNASAYYNRYRTKAEGGFRWWLRSGVDESERLTDFPQQYEYVVNTSYNVEQVRHRGAGIFLHVNGRGATAGCVSVPRAAMQRIVGWLDPAAVPVIAIGR